VKNVAIIGTAGRDYKKPMTEDLWYKMWEDASKRFATDDFHLVSGGAAWADHLAVAMYLKAEVKGLTLHLPAPFDLTARKFVGPAGSAASAANYYHEKFSKLLGSDTLGHIAYAISAGAKVTEQPSAPGYGAMFTRNNLVAADGVHGVLAYTWGEGKVPADGGTKYTWDKSTAPRKVHVPLSKLLEG
jgi:hypothetical protein